MVRRLRVVAVARGFGFPEGMAAARRLRLLSRALVESGANVTVLCTQVSEVEPDVVNERVRGRVDGIDYEYTTGTPLRPADFVTRRTVEGRGLVRAAERLHELARGQESVCVYCWVTSQRWTPARASLVRFSNLLGVPVVIELNEPPWPMRECQSPIERATSPISGVSGVVAISAVLADWAVEKAKRRRRPLSVCRVPVVADPAEFSDLAEGFDADPMQLVYSGSGRVDATLVFTLDCLALVVARGWSCSLLVTGLRQSGAAMRQFEQHIASRGLQANVRLTGHLSRERLIEVYQSSAALLVPLLDDVRSESRFPTKMAEYLASGRPVVTTNVGEVRRYLTDARTAFVSSPTASDYANSVCQALENLGVSRLVGLAGRKVALQHFDYSRYGSALVSLFREACGYG